MNTRMQSTIMAALSLSLLSFACAAGAQDPAPPASAADCVAIDYTALGKTPPPEQQAGSISFVSGGIGAPQSEAMRAIKSGFPLALTFAEHLDGKDAYTAMVTVTLRDAEGNQVLCVSNAGPMLFLRLPTGTYTITARSYGGVELTRNVSVRADGHQDVTLIWQPQ